MAYHTHYIIQFSNPLGEDVIVELQKKDEEPESVQEYKSNSVIIRCNSQDQGRFAPIISREIEITFRIYENDNDYIQQFLDAQADTWRCVATVDGQSDFHGFVVPDEGSVPFQDKPYDATIRATDGLNLLKNITLTDINGDNFDDEDLIITYVAAALKKTRLELPIRVYDNVYHASHLTRANNWKWDFMGQTKLEYRTFLKDAVTFVDCYEALMKILSRSYRLAYWNGEWVIMRLSLLQYVPYVLYYTIYDHNGENAVGYEDLETYATVGKNETILPINKDQTRSSMFATKSVKTVFDYEVWPELPKNNKFERGELVAMGDAYDDLDLDGDDDTSERIGTYRSYRIDNWTYGRINISGTVSLDPVPGFALTPGSDYPYRRSVKNDYGNEILREIYLPVAGSGQAFWMRSEGIPVVEGGRIKFAADVRSISTVGNFINVALIYIVPDGGGQGYALQAGKPNEKDGMWKKEIAEVKSGPGVNYGYGYIMISYSDEDDSRQYHSVSVESQPIPVTGTMYVVINSQGTNQKIFRNISLEYLPFIAGGLVEVKGDYWFHSQNASYQDRSDEKVSLSDNRHKIFKGCLLDNSGVPLSSNFNRDGISEQRSYKELTNIAEFNQLYRRFWSVEGSFRGTKYASASEPTNKQPISFHKQYRFVDLPEDRRFMLGHPLQINLSSGQNRSVFWEVNKEEDGDGQQLGDNSEFNYTFS